MCPELSVIYFPRYLETADLGFTKDANNDQCCFYTPASADRSYANLSENKVFSKQNTTLITSPVLRILTEFWHIHLQSVFNIILFIITPSRQFHKELFEKTIFEQMYVVRFSTYNCDCVLGYYSSTLQTWTVSYLIMIKVVVLLCF